MKTELLKIRERLMDLVDASRWRKVKTSDLEELVAAIDSILEAKK